MKSLLALDFSLFPPPSVPNASYTLAPPLSVQSARSLAITQTNATTPQLVAGVLLLTSRVHTPAPHPPVLQTAARVPTL